MASTADRPAVSVILATYNWPSVLRYAIQSVLAQSFDDFELLVVGDCCTDDTAELVASFGDSRVHWHNLPENTGNQAGPNNAGLQMARGEYTAYMHQDDLWMPDHLALLASALQADDVPLAHTLLLEVSPPPAKIRRIVGLPGSGKFGVDRVDLWTPAVMHRTEVGRRIGGWRDWRSIYDTPFRDFLSRVIGPSARFRSVPEMTVVKFHSGQRRNSYLDQPCAEQAEYFERIQSEPDFRYRELLHALEANARGLADRRLIDETPLNAGPGWEVEQIRRVRGLPPSELSSASFGRRARVPLGFLLESAERRARASLRSVAESARNHTPRSIRNRAAYYLSRTARFIEP